MSTSLVMMDTGVHRRSALNNSSTIVGDLKSTLVSNVPINFARKFLANNNINNNQQHHSVTAAHTPSVSIKLEPRVPSPCPADLAATVRGDISCQLSSATGKDLQFYLANKTATITEEQLHQHLLVKGTMNSVDANIVGNVATALSIKQRRSADDSYMASGQTILPNSTSARSPSPPPLLPNGHYYSQSPTTTNTTITTTNNNHHHHHNNTNSPFTGTLSGQMLKRDHDDAFGPSSTTTTSVTINISSSNNNSLASLPSSTNSPSPPPLMTNGHHSAVVNSLLVNGGNIASPTSSSFSDFGSTGKEDMSPSNSVSGYVDSLGGDPKKKKGPAPRQQEELCLVCGDRASGYHYNALTCEGCKGFFRRSITKNAVYQCKYGNNCEIDMYMRRKCQECRLKKCLSVGMRPECVVPEYQCAIKREAKRAIKDKDKPNSTTKDGHLSPGTPQMINDDKQPSTPQMQTNWCTQNGTEVVENSNKKLSPHQESVIKKLVYYQEEFESPSEDDIKKIAPFPQGEKEDDNQKRLQHITEMTILTVQLIVEFSKRVPCFDKLFREDQITLLKACSSEVMMLRCSRKYDIRTDSIVYANNQPYTRDNYSSASISYVAESLFNFCRRMCVLKVDNAEYALLTAIVIFSDRPQLVEPRKVESIQEQYIETLRDYVEAKRPMNNCHFAKLLGILTELRTLGNINSEMCVSLKVQNKKLPPFLAEIWDIQEF